MSPLSSCPLHPRRRLAALLTLLIGGVAACGGDSASPDDLGPPKFIIAVAGDSQQVAAGEAPAIVPTFQVQDPGRRPIPGVRVDFSVLLDGALIGNYATTTGRDGIATLETYRAGPRAGRTEVLVASPSNNAASAAIRIRVVGAVATSITEYEPWMVVPGRAMQPFPTTPTYRVTDRFNNRVAGARVRFDVPVDPSSPIGGISAYVDTTPVLSDANGIARPLAYTSYVATAGALRARVEGTNLILVTAPNQFRTCGALASLSGRSSHQGVIELPDPNGYCPSDTTEVYALVVTQPSRLVASTAANGIVDVALRIAPSWREPLDVVPARRSFVAYLPAGVYDVRLDPAASALSAGRWPWLLSAVLSTPAIIDECVETWLVAHATLAGRLAAGDCVAPLAELSGADARYDDWAVHAGGPLGARVRATLSDAPAGARLVLYGRRDASSPLQLVATDAAAGTSRTIDATLPSELAEAVVRVAVPAPTTGTYVLTLQP